MTQQNQPIHRIRIGSVTAAIFENKGEEGRPPFHNVSFDRSIKTQEGWTTTRSFGRTDLLNLAKVADQAHTLLTQIVQARSGPDQPAEE